MKIIVTGAEGQLGKEFRKYFEKYTHDEAIYFNKESLDITNFEKILEILTQLKPDVVINCAAYNAVDHAEEDDFQAKRVNTYGVQNLARACHERLALLIHYSTDYIFDGSKKDFYLEKDMPNPINKYGVSKLLGEQLIAREMSNFLIFRVSWIFGDGLQNFFAKMLHWMGEDHIVYVPYDQISVPTYTEDIVQATSDALKKHLRGIYHLTNTGYASRYEAAHYFVEVLSEENLILPVPSSFFPVGAKRPLFSAMSNTSLSRDLGYNIPHWRDGVDRFIRNIIKNR